MKPIIFAIFILLSQSLLSQAHQFSKNKKTFTGYYFFPGLGAFTLSPLKGDPRIGGIQTKLELGLIQNNHVFALAQNTQVTLGEMGISFDFLYGRIYRIAGFNFEAQSGFSLITGDLNNKKWTDDQFPEKPAFAVPLRIGAHYLPVDFLSLGLEAGANLSNRNFKLDNHANPPLWSIKKEMRSL